LPTRVHALLKLALQRFRISGATSERHSAGVTSAGMEPTEHQPIDVEAGMTSAIAFLRDRRDPAPRLAGASWISWKEL